MSSFSEHADDLSRDKLSTYYFAGDEDRLSEFATKVGALNRDIGVLDGSPSFDEAVGKYSEALKDSYAYVFDHLVGSLATHLQHLVESPDAKATPTFAHALDAMADATHWHSEPWSATSKKS